MSREALLKKSTHKNKFKKRVQEQLQEQTSFVQVEMTQVYSSGKWPASFFKKCKYLAQLCILNTNIQSNRLRIKAAKMVPPTSDHGAGPIFAQWSQIKGMSNP